MRAIRVVFLLSISILIVIPGRGFARQNAAAPPPDTTAAQGSAAAPNAASRLPDYSPQAIRGTRVQLYFQAARSPLAKLAPQVYTLASNSERCRLNSGASACDLPAAPLKGSELKQIFKYYVRVPVEAALSQQRLDVHKSDWTWQPYVNRRSR